MKNLIPVLALLASSMVSAYEDLPCSEDTDDHGRRLSILAASVEAYIVEHGKWPSEVGDLIPVYLDKNAEVLEAAPVTFIVEKNLIVSGSCLLEETADMRSLQVCFYNVETNESNCELE
jgi:hypothetical protein